MRDVGAELAHVGRLLDEQVRTAATERELVLGDQLGGAQQAVLADLRARPRAEFDRSWAAAALDAAQRARSEVPVVLPADAAPVAKGLARLDTVTDRLARLR